MRQPSAEPVHTTDPDRSTGEARTLIVPTGEAGAQLSPAPRLAVTGVTKGLTISLSVRGHEQALSAAMSESQTPPEWPWRDCDVGVLTDAGPTTGRTRPSEQRCRLFVVTVRPVVTVAARRPPGRRRCPVGFLSRSRACSASARCRLRCFRAVRHLMVLSANPRAGDPPVSEPPW